MIARKHRSQTGLDDDPQGGNMKNLMMNWLHDLAVALGLIPPMQPVPIPSDDEKRKRQPRR